MARPKAATKEVEEVDYIQIVKDATPHMGSSLFTRINLEDEITQEGKNELHNEYSVLGYEVFFGADDKSVLLQKQ